jgi:hypothetical protein
VLSLLVVGTSQAMDQRQTTAIDQLNYSN